MTDRVVVLHDEFVAAVSALPKMSRGPRGSFGNKVPKDTLLYASDGRLVVYTPVNKFVLGMTGAWSVCLSVDARRLASLSAKLKPRELLTLTYAGELLVLNEPAFAIPASPAEVPLD